jgi:hypothetical protein
MTRYCAAYAVLRLTVTWPWSEAMCHVRRQAAEVLGGDMYTKAIEEVRRRW